MEKEDTNFWEQFFEATAEGAPSVNLVEALKYVPGRELGYDLGAGALRDTKFLAQQGFRKVVAVDLEPQVLAYAERLTLPNIMAESASLEEYAFKDKEADIITIQNVLPFLKEEEIGKVLARSIDALKTGGIISATFFGYRDGWSGSTSRKVTLLGEEQIREYFRDLEVLMFKEQELDGETPLGINKHWHRFRVIAQKK